MGKKVSKRDTQLRPVRAWCDEMRTGAGGQKIEERHFVGNVQSLKPQGPTHAIGVEQTVGPDADVE